MKKMSGSYKRVNFYDLCRLCAQNIQQNKAKIFEPEGQKIQLQTKIKKCLSITINENDFLPKVVCLKCIKQLEVCNAFREECLNSETMLSSYFKNYRHTEDFKKSGKVYIKDTVKSDTPAETPQPVFNRNKYPTKSGKNEPINVVPLTTYLQKPEPCSKSLNNTKPVFTGQNFSCKKTKTNPDIQSHLNMVPQVQTMQLPYSIDAINEALKKAVQQLPKELLNKVVVNGEIINLSASDPLGLDPMSIPSNIMNGLTSVIKNKHVKPKDFLRHVNEPLSLESNIIKIDLTDDDNVPDIPSSKYSSIPYIAQKSLQNSGQPTMQNPTVIFPVPQYQNNFTPVQTNNISYPPQTTVNISPSTPTVINVICSNSSEPNPSLAPINQSPPSSINMDDLRGTNYISTAASQSSLPKAGIPEDHVKKKQQQPKNDEPTKIYTCEACSKTFKRREHLYQHVKLHTGFRPYRCTECNKSFVRKEHLLRHLVLHSGERNYTCEICNKSFSRNDNLLKHIRTHNKESAYTCDVCQKVFIIKHYYDTHRSEQGKCYLPPQIGAC